MQPHMKKSLDLTDLSIGVSRDEILALCQRAIYNSQFVAAVCSWPIHAATISEYLWDEGFSTTIKTAIVSNFPYGTLNLDNICYTAELALSHGAQEIDLVIDWEKYNQRQTGIFETVRAVRNLSNKEFTLKVILETGKLKNSLINAACIEAMEGGADFLKTSTGKTTRGAELGATKIMCEAVKNYYLSHSRRVGLKYSGGIITDLDAMKFIWQLNSHDLGSWLDHGLIRFGVGTSSKVLRQWGISEGSFESPTIQEAVRAASKE